MASGQDRPDRSRRGPARGQEPVVDLRAVARSSGVSAATVSRALNGRPEVSEATRAHVTETARRLGYLPNQQARTLARRRSDTIGLIWDSSYVETQGRQPFLQDLLVGLKMALAETGYHLMLLSPQIDDHTPDKFIRAVVQHSLDGVALMAINEHVAVDALVASGSAMRRPRPASVRPAQQLCELRQPRRRSRGRQPFVRVRTSPHCDDQRPNVDAARCRTG